tara:strand:- start:14514 stop:14738 length:225 start_codon:yes stop_codon:yes gene_type:complete
MIYDVMQAKPGKEGKTYWRNLGVAFEKNGRISSIKLECLPLPNTEGEVFLQIFEQKPKGNGSDEIKLSDNPFDE